MKKILSLILCCVLLTGSLSGCGSAKTENDTVLSAVRLPDWADQLSEEGLRRCEDLIRKGKLIFGTSADYAPYEFHAIVNGKDTVVGYDIHIAKFIAQELNVKYQTIDTKFEKLFTRLNNEEFDFAGGSLLITEERDAEVDFTDIYFTPSEVIVVRNEEKNNYNSLADLKNVRAGAVRGTPQETIARTHSGSSVVLFDTALDAINAMTNSKNKTIDILYLASDVGKGFAAANPDLTWRDVGIPSQAEGVAFACREGDTGMVEIINLLLSMITPEDMEKWWADAYTQAGSYVLVSN